jgi:hypothetical protein
VLPENSQISGLGLLLVYLKCDAYTLLQPAASLLLKG